MSDCLCCDRLADTIVGNNPYYVAYLAGGDLVVADDFIDTNKFIYIFRSHKERLSDLSDSERNLILPDLMRIDEYIRNELNPVNVHYELLGDAVPHLHWHITPIFKEMDANQFAHNHKRFWNKYWSDKE